jgi:hypothetical protein
MNADQSYTNNKTEEIDKDREIYLSQLSEKEKITLKSAEDILGSSFNLKKSIGFKEWQNSQIRS